MGCRTTASGGGVVTTRGFLGAGHWLVQGRGTEGRSGEERMGLWRVTMWIRRPRRRGTQSSLRN